MGMTMMLLFAISFVFGNLILVAHGAGPLLEGLTARSANRMDLVQGNSVRFASLDWQPTTEGAPWNCYCDSDVGSNWLGFEVNGLVTVDGVGIRGRNWVGRTAADTNRNFIETFSLSYSLDGVTWNAYENGQVLTTGVTAPRDPDATVVVELKPFLARYVRIKSLSSGPQGWGCMRVGFYGKGGEVNYVLGAPLGLASNLITDDQISALTTFWTGENACAPKNGRVSSNAGAGSWCAQVNQPGQYLQIDLMGTAEISGFGTQGRNPLSQIYRGAQQWITSYQIQYSTDGIAWSFHTVNRTPMLFTGNFDSVTVVHHSLETPIQARFIRFVVQNWFSHISLRAELYGRMISKLDIGSPLGLASGAIGDGFISSSSNFPCGGCCDSLNARLMSASGAGSWCAASNDKNQWIQVDLPGLTTVNAISLQARNTASQVYQGAMQWVTTYFILTSMDGSTWAPVSASVGGPAFLFRGNSDSTTTVTQTLPSPTSCRYLRVSPQTWNGHISLRFELYGEVTKPNALGVPLGLESGAIPDNQIFSSTRYPGSAGEYDPANGRLNGARGVGSWSALTNDENQWFMVDFGGATSVTGVATQGRNNDGEIAKNANQWVTSYSLQYSADSVEWAYYTRGDERVVFRGNVDSSTPRIYVLDPPVQARYVRIRPLSWNNHISLRAEFYGTQNEKLRVGTALGLESGQFPQNAFTCSDTFGGTWGASFGIINGPGAWIPRPLNRDQWWQIDFGRTLEVGGIATQGRPGIDQWVTNYEVVYARDDACANWFPYQENGKSRLFFGNSNWRTVVPNAFVAPFVARCVRVLPRSWNGHIAMRFELYRPDYTRRPALQNIGEPLGVQSGVANLTASSQYDDSCKADNGRLRSQAGSGGWCSKLSMDFSGWLQVNIGSVQEVAGVATQGRYAADPDSANTILQWVTSYVLDSSADGGETWTPYTEFGVRRVFRGNLDSNTLVTHSLRNPIKAQFIRFIPQGVFGHTTMRVEVYGSAAVMLARRAAIEAARLAKEKADADKEKENAAALVAVREQTLAKVAAEKAAAQAATELRRVADAAAEADRQKLEALDKAARAARDAAAANRSNQELQEQAAAARKLAVDQQNALRASLQEAQEANRKVEAARAQVAANLEAETKAKNAIRAEADKLRAEMADLKDKDAAAAFMRVRYENAVKRINALEEMIRVLRINLQRATINAAGDRGDSAAKDADIEKLRTEVASWKEAALKAQSENARMVEEKELARKQEERARQLAAEAALLRETTSISKSTPTVAGSKIIVASNSELSLPDNFPLPNAPPGQEDPSILVPSVTKTERDMASKEAQKEITK